jgi:hypothetical protein
MATSGRFGVGERALEGLELADQQGSRAGHLGELANAVRRRLGAMRGTKCIHHIDVT